MQLFRRSLLQMGSSLAVALPLPSFSWAQAVREIRMLESGGRSGDSIEAYIKPFTAATGIRVVRESPSSLGKLRSMVEARNVTTVLVECASSTLEQAQGLGLLEPIDWNVVNPDSMFPDARHPMGFGFQYYSSVMAWRSDAKAPRSWADFWDAKAFPGRRALPDRAQYALPFALFADGVEPSRLYPLDLDRAFRSLKRIEPSVTVWWSTNAQPAQLLLDNEVQYAIALSGRVANTPGLSFTFDSGQLQCSYMCVPKGANPTHKAAAMRLLQEFSRADNQAEAAKVISYTGPSPDLAALLPRERIGEFPTAHKERQFLVDDAWWLANLDVVQRRWQDFKLSL